MLLFLEGSEQLRETYMLAFSLPLDIVCLAPKPPHIQL